MGRSTQVPVEHLGSCGLTRNGPRRADHLEIRPVREGSKFREGARSSTDRLLACGNRMRVQHAYGVKHRGCNTGRNDGRAAAAPSWQLSWSVARWALGRHPQRGTQTGVRQAARAGGRAACSGACPQCSAASSPHVADGPSLLVGASLDCWLLPLIFICKSQYSALVLALAYRQQLAPPPRTAGECGRACDRGCVPHRHTPPRMATDSGFSSESPLIAFRATPRPAALLGMVLVLIPLPVQAI